MDLIENRYSKNALGKARVLSVGFLAMSKRISVLLVGFYCVQLLSRIQQQLHENSTV